MDKLVYEIAILQEDKEFRMDNNIFLDFWDYCEERSIDCYVFENIMPIRMVFDTEEHFLEAIRDSSGFYSAPTEEDVKSEEFKSLDFDPFKSFCKVIFSYGYTKRTMTFAFKGIDIDTGIPEWGAEPNKEYFVIKLGRRLK